MGAGNFETLEYRPLHIRIDGRQQFTESDFVTGFY